MLRDLRFGTIKLISALFAPAVRVLDFRKNPPPDLRIITPKRALRLNRSRFTLIGSEPFWLGMNFTLDANYSIDLQNVDVVGKGIVVSQEGKVVLESTLFQLEYLRRSHQNHLIVLRKLLPASHHHYALPLAYYLDWSYFHWMLEDIGRLFLVRERLADPDLEILIDHNAPAFVRDSIRFFFNVPEKHIVSEPHKRKKIDRCLLVSFPHTRNADTHGADIYPPEVIRLINSAALQKMSRVAGSSSAYAKASASEASDPAETVNIIITRRATHQRRILNEQAIIDCFPDLNFRIVECEAMTFLEQVDLFSHAGIIIATHGAGLANLLFTRDPLVIEFYPNDREEKDSVYFAQITTALSMRHHQLHYTPANEHEDLRIDEQLLGALERIFEAK